MGSETVLHRFDDLSIWKQGDQRAPHKPLLVLYALGRWQAGQKDVTFREAEPDLTALLREFGRPRKSDHPEQPFWRLQRDGVWIVHTPAGLALKTGNDIPRVGELRSNGVQEEISPEVRSADPRPAAPSLEARAAPSRMAHAGGLQWGSEAPRLSRRWGPLQLPGQPPGRMLTVSLSCLTSVT